MSKIIFFPKTTVIMLLCLSITIAKAQVAFDPPGPPIAAGKPKFLGGVHSIPQKPNFNKYWNQLTPENAGKWGSVERVRDVMNWSELDSAYDMAKANNIPFKLHTLIWGSQQPGWIESLSPAEQLEEIKEWFAALALRYPAIDFIEVVNEPLHAKPDKPGTGNYIQALGGNGNTGWDWVLNSFRLARQYFPTSKLWINDYSIVNDGNAVTTYLSIINLLKNENLIDGIGEQAHAFTTKGTPASTLRNNLTRLAAAGLPLYATELDIDGPGAAEVNGMHVDNPSADAIQLEEYKRVFPIFWEHPAVEGVTLWGYRPGHWRTNQGAFIAYSDNSERPALQWLRNYVETSTVVFPITLTEFDAKIQNLSVNVSWSAIEEKNDYFIVERSIDGRSFATLTTVKSQGVPQQVRRYAVEDRNPGKGLNYYRLVQVDLDGKRTLHSVKMVNFNTKNNLFVQVYPNPVKTSFTIRTDPSVTNALLINSNGSLVRKIVITGGIQTVANLNLPVGTYYLKVMKDKDVYSIPVYVTGK